MQTPTVCMIQCLCPLPDICAGSLDANAFADRLWGDIYYNPGTRKFIRKPADPEMNRSFVHFILEPLYKLYSNVLSEDTDTLMKTLDGLGIRLKPVMYKMDVRPLLKAILNQFFGPSTGLVDVIVDHIPSPSDGASGKVKSSLHIQLSDSHSSRPLGRTNLYRPSNVRSCCFNESLRRTGSGHGTDRKTVPYNRCTVV